MPSASSGKSSAFFDTKFLKGHGRIRDLRLDSPVGEDGRLIEEGHLLGGILCGFGGLGRRLVFGRKGRKQIRLAALIRIGFSTAGDSCSALCAGAGFFCAAGSAASTVSSVFRFACGFPGPAGVRPQPRRVSKMAAMSRSPSSSSGKVKGVSKFTHGSWLLSFSDKKKTATAHMGNYGLLGPVVFWYSWSVLRTCLGADCAPASFPSTLQCSALQCSRPEIHLHCTAMSVSCKLALAAREIHRKRKGAANVVFRFT